MPVRAALPDGHGFTPQNRNIMANGLTHFECAEQLLLQSRSISADDLEPAQLLTVTLIETVAHAVLALAEDDSLPATRVWWLDDGQENPGPPEIYTTEEAARSAAEKRYAEANPLAAGVTLAWQLTEDVETDDDGAPVDELYDMELIGAGWRTGYVVRPIQPKDLA